MKRRSVFCGCGYAFLFLVTLGLLLPPAQSQQQCDVTVFIQTSGMAVVIPNWVSSVCVMRHENDIISSPIEVLNGSCSVASCSAAAGAYCVGLLDNTNSDTCSFNVSWSVEENNEILNNTLEIEFQTGIPFTCKNYIFHQNYETDRILLSCEPLNETGSNGNCVEWWKSYDSNTLNLLKNGKFVPDDSYGFHSSRSDRDVIALSEAQGVTNGTLTITGPTPISVGYYYIRPCGSMETIHSFVVYYPPEALPIIRFEELKDEPISKTVVNGTQMYTDIRCVVRSFPPVSASWTFQQRDANTSSPLNTTSPHFSLAVLPDNEIDVFYENTTDGQLVILNVDYGLGGFYNCVATNVYANATVVNKLYVLRVRDKLRPLWPALGIVASFIITALFIFGGWVVDKCHVRFCSKKVSSSTRPFSVSSDDNDAAALPYEEDNSNNDKKSGERRQSRRLLLRESSDL